MTTCHFESTKWIGWATSLHIDKVKNIFILIWPFTLLGWLIYRPSLILLIVVNLLVVVDILEVLLRFLNPLNWLNIWNESIWRRRLIRFHSYWISLNRPIVTICRIVSYSWISSSSFHLNNFSGGTVILIIVDSRVSITILIKIFKIARSQFAMILIRTTHHLPLHFLCFGHLLIQHVRWNVLSSRILNEFLIVYHLLLIPYSLFIMVIVLLNTIHFLFHTLRPQIFIHSWSHIVKLLHFPFRCCI
jgi:hypothetical protein